MEEFKPREIRATGQIRASHLVSMKVTHCGPVHCAGCGQQIQEPYARLFIELDETNQEINWRLGLN